MFHCFCRKSILKADTIMLGMWFCFVSSLTDYAKGCTEEARIIAIHKGYSNVVNNLQLRRNDLKWYAMHAIL